MIAAILFGAVAVLVLGAGLALSWRMTRRAVLTEVQTPTQFGLTSEEVTFSATDGTRLRGWWIPSPGSDRAVIVLHGHGGSMDMDLHRAPALHAAGFNVLLFDFRAHGRSQGQTITFGFLERRDVLGALEFARQRGMRRVGLLGFSLGGMVSILSAAVCPGVGAVVTDGGPARMRTAMTVWLVERQVPTWLSEALAWLTVVVTSLRLRASPFRYDPVLWVGRIAPCAVLFIHGDRDQYCPDFDDLFAAAEPPKELWRVPEAGHVTLSATHPDEHQRRVIAFFQQYL